MKRISEASLPMIITIALAGFPPSRMKHPDSWSSSVGTFRLVETEGRRSARFLGKKQVIQFEIPANLRASFLRGGIAGDELYVIQLNAVDSSWLHVLEVSEKGAVTVSPMFGKGGDLPLIRDDGSLLRIEFEPLDLPRCKVEGQIWQYEKHSLKRAN